MLVPKLMQYDHLSQSNVKLNGRSLNFILMEVRVSLFFVTTNVSESAL